MCGLLEIWCALQEHEPDISSSRAQPTVCGQPGLLVSPDACSYDIQYRLLLCCGWRPRIGQLPVWRQQIIRCLPCTVIACYEVQLLLKNEVWNSQKSIRICCTHPTSQLTCTSCTKAVGSLFINPARTFAQTVFCWTCIVCIINILGSSTCSQPFVC